MMLENAFCKKCGAWYGQLGLEPTLALYVDHLLEITKELKRVLKPTGVLFWNHGDSYGGSGNASGHTDETLNCGKKTSEYGATRGHTFGFMPKCMLLQNYHLVMKMVEDDGDDDYELRTDLSIKEKEYVLKELKQKGLIL